MSEVTFEGKDYTIDDQCFLSNRFFDKSWSGVQEGDEYLSEWCCNGIDENGNKVMVTWQFDTVKGFEPDDDSYWPWKDRYITSVHYQ